MATINNGIFSTTQVGTPTEPISQIPTTGRALPTSKDRATRLAMRTTRPLSNWEKQSYVALLRDYIAGKLKYSDHDRFHELRQRFIQEMRKSRQVKYDNL